MRISIVAVGTRMPAWVAQGVAEYTKRMPQSFGIRVEEVAGGQRAARGDAQRAQAEETRHLLKRSSGADLVIALDERGRTLTSDALAEEMRGWLDSGSRVALLIGGPDGLSAECRERANWVWSLSAMTLPHGLARIMLAEQLYRAWTILQGHPYHRGAKPAR